MGEAGGGGGVATHTDLILRNRQRMAESPIFALAERPEPR